MIAASRGRRFAVAAAPLVALVWLAALVAAASADGYDSAPVWLLLVNQLVLAPAAVVATLSLGSAVGGRAVALLAALLLALLAPLGAFYALSGYRDTYVDRVLPEAAGIASGGRFAAGALSLVAAALAATALRAADRRAVVLAGLAAGGASLAHPGGVLVLAGIALAAAVSVRPVEGALMAAAAAPGVALAAVVHGIGLDVSWEAFTGSMTGLREYLWSNRLLQWLPVAGVIGAMRGSPPVAALVGGWFAAFAVVYGASPNLPTDDGSYLVAFVPALPALCLLVASVPLLVPTLPRRLERLGSAV